MTCSSSGTGNINTDLAQAERPPKLIHREESPDGRVVAYYRAGLSWRIYWEDEDAGNGMSGGFDSLADARRDAETVLAAEANLTQTPDATA